MPREIKVGDTVVSCLDPLRTFKISIGKIVEIYKKKETRWVHYFNPPKEVITEATKFKIKWEIGPLKGRLSVREHPIPLDPILDREIDNISYQIKRFNEFCHKNNIQCRLPSLPGKE